MSPAIAVWAPVAVIVFVAMDFWAAFLHGRIWHRALWRVHRSHHQARHGIFELNDALALLHVPIAVALILYGCWAAPSVLREVLFGVGVGASAFGVAYFIVHDGMVHRRLPVRGLLRIRYLGDVARAHRVHHAGKLGGPPFGLFFGPRELARHARHARHERDERHRRRAREAS